MKLISRAEAKAQGLKRYFTGEPCANGHVAERFVNNYGCRECFRIYHLIKGGHTDLRRFEDRKAHPSYITKKEAKAQGLKRYFTGEPCSKGHIADRRVNHGMCVECEKIRMGNLSAEQKAKRRENERKWRLENRKSTRAYRRKWRANNIAKGLTIDGKPRKSVT